MSEKSTDYLARRQMKFVTDMYGNQTDELTLDYELALDAELAGALPDAIDLRQLDEEEEKE